MKTYDNASDNKNEGNVIDHLVELLKRNHNYREPQFTPSTFVEFMRSHPANFKRTFNLK